MPPVSFARLLFLCSVPILGGCLHFETQTIDFRYDAASDTATFHLVYHGLFWDKNSGGPKALKRALDNNEACLVDWPFHFQPQEIRGDKDPNIRFLAENLKAERVGFFLNAKGQLSGGQIVTLTKVSDALKMANGLLSQWIIDGKGHPEDSEWDRHTGAMLLAAAQKGHAWYRMQGNALAFHAFCSDHDYMFAKREGLKDFFDSIVDSEKEDRLMELEWLVRMPLSLSRDGNAITVVVGNPNGASRLEVPTEGRKPYKDNLLAYARETWRFDLDKKVAPLLVNPDDSALGRFAAAMSLPERVRILLTQEGDKATARLAAALEELPKLPDGEIGDVRAFWKGLLEKWVNPPKPQEKEEEPGKEDK